MKSTDNLTNKPVTNPYHVARSNGGSGAGEAGAIGALKHEVEDLIKLELTAEQMLGQEVDLAKAYIREDTHGLWQDMKLGLAELEVFTGDWLLRAADPTRVDWQLNHWWEDEESQFRH
jgi:hypothetical protein